MTEPRILPLDAESENLFRRVMDRARYWLQTGIAAAGDGRIEVHVVFVARGKKLTRESRVLPAAEHPTD